MLKTLYAIGLALPRILFTPWREFTIAIPQSGWPVVVEGRRDTLMPTDALVSERNTAIMADLLKKTKYLAEKIAEAKRITAREAPVAEPRKEYEETGPAAIIKLYEDAAIDAETRRQLAEIVLQNQTSDDVRTACLLTLSKALAKASDSEARMVALKVIEYLGTARNTAHTKESLGLKAEGGQDDE